MSKRKLVVHFVNPVVYEVNPQQAICGETNLKSIVEGKNWHIRHVYVTKSLSLVNCPTCMQYVGLLILANTDLGY